MSIDKESNGLPEVNVQRRATKVNLWMIAAVVLFLGIMSLAALFISRASDSAAGIAPSASGGDVSPRP